jgi:hypothetical protein
MREARRLRDAYRDISGLEDEAKHAWILCRAVWMMTPLRFWMAHETAESSRLMKAFRPPIGADRDVHVVDVRGRLRREPIAAEAARARGCRRASDVGV